MRPLRDLSRHAAIGLALMTMTACTATTGPLGNPQDPYPAAAPPAVGTIRHLPTGTPVTSGQMLAAVTDYRLVFVGETHDNPASHRLELDVLRAMAERWPGRVSLGLEMFTVEQQDVLDQWVRGELDERTFLKQSRWQSVWSMDFAYYRAILEFARDQSIPVIGLNAPKELVKAVGKTPLEELDPELRARLPEMDLADPYQRAMASAVFAGHDAGPQRMDGFVRVQTLWDEQMAQSVARHLEQAGPEQRMVVMAGGNHVRYGFGIPRRVYRRLPASYVLVGSHEVEIPPEKQDRMMDITPPDYPMPAYDYLVYTAYESLPDDKVKLGVRMDDESGRVVVKGVVEGSSAAVAGVSEGDVILSLGGVSIADSFDLVYEVGQRRAGDTVELLVERAGTQQVLNVTFQPLPEHGK